MFSDHIGTLPGAPRQNGAVPRSFLLLAGLLANRKDNQTRSGGHQKDSEGAVLPDSIVAGDGQVGRPGVDDRQGDDGVDGAVVFQHGHGLAVNGGGGGQQRRAADLAELVALRGGDDDGDGVLQERVALGGVGLPRGIQILFPPESGRTREA